MKSKSLSICFALLLFAVQVYGQTPPATLANLQTDMVSTWLITVGTEPRSFERSLKVNSVLAKPEGGFALDIDYSVLGSKADRRLADLVVPQGQTPKIIFTTGANSKIAAEQAADGSFQGTFTDAKGAILPLKMVKISEESLRRKESQLLAAKANATVSAAPVIEQPTADVPAACAAFVGGWSGRWPFVGRTWIWIVSVDAKCGAKYAYTGTSVAVPKEFLSAEIKDGVLTVPIPGGTIAFQMRDGELVGLYSGPGGNSGASMRKVDLTGDALAKLRDEQRAERAAPVAAVALDAPATCASFFGAWKGTWSQGGFGPLWLRVVGVDSNCYVRLSYMSSSETPRNFFVTQIKDGSLAFLCNPSTGGTCVFERKGSDLWANYSNPGGGRNNAVFQKTE